MGKILPVRKSKEGQESNQEEGLSGPSVIYNDVFQHIPRFILFIFFLFFLFCLPRERGKEGNKGKVALWESPLPSFINSFIQGFNSLLDFSFASKREGLMTGSCACRIFQNGFGKGKFLPNFRSSNLCFSKICRVNRSLVVSGICRNSRA